MHIINYGWSFALYRICFHVFQKGGHLSPSHDDVIKWEHFPRYWPFVRGIHRSPMNSPHKGQWRGALMFSLICAWIYGWVNNREGGDLRRHHVHYGVIVMPSFVIKSHFWFCQNVFQIFETTFIFRRCHHSWAVVTPAKYEFAIW